MVVDAGMGLNYFDHAEEHDSEVEVPAEPMLFAKFPTSVVGPDAVVEWDPELTDAVDLEAELGIVIGRRARRVPKAEALDYVLGYTCANDVSARDWQIQWGGSQWCRGKTFDTFCPLGPCLVTPEDIPELDKLIEVSKEFEIDLRNIIVEYLEKIASADNEVSEDEQAMLNKVKEGLEIQT